MRAGQLLAEAEAMLAERGVDSPRLSAQLMLAHALGISRDQLVLDLLTNADRELDPDQEEQARAFLARRAKGEPAAYILGSREFYGLDFRVTPDVLIPRPETEHIIEAVEQRFRRDAPLRLADLGTGSGVLAVTLCVRFQRARAVALDLSLAALEVARENAGQHGVLDRVALVWASFDPAPLGPASCDLIVANPPYVTRDEYRSLSPEVRDHEPESALVPGQGGETGLEAAGQVVRTAATALVPGGLLLMEIGCAQGADALDLVRGEPWQEAAIIKDLAGLDRILMASLGH